MAMPPGVGKIGHGYSDKKLFDVYAGKFSGSGPKPPNGKRFNYYPPEVPWTGTQTDWGAFPDRDEDMTDHKVADWAVDRLSRKSDKPFFLGVGFMRPHVPFYAPQKWLDLFPLEKIKLPPVLMDDLSDVPETSRRMHELPKYPNLDFLRKNEDEQFRKCALTWPALPLSIIRSAASWTPWIKVLMPRTLRSFFLAIMGITSGKRTE